MKVIFYRDKSRNWRWRLKSPNGRIIADSAEGYIRLRDCRRGWEAVLRGAWTAADVVKR